MERLKVDLCIIGGGSGGLTTAAVAANLGATTVLFESHKMGGDCLNYGCVPSKALLAAGKAVSAVKSAGSFGIEASSGVVDISAVRAHVRSVISTIEPHDSVERFTSLGVRVIEQGAHFISRNTVCSTDGSVEVEARKFVIATGSSPNVPPIPGLDSVEYFTNETIFENDKTLEHLIVIGGGPIGMELSQAHRRLGSQVTVLEATVPLGKDDPELTKIALDAIADDGVDVRSGTMVKSVKSAPQGQITVTYELDGEQQSVTGSHLLVALGRRPNVQNLGLEAAGIECNRAGIVVSSGLRTTNRNVYAIGDVAGGLQFTHTAGYQAGLVIRSALFAMPIRNRTDHMPWTTYTDPEVANVGMNEKAARGKYGNNIRVLRFNLDQIDRAQAERKTKGMIKVITKPNGVVLGAGIVGAGAGELLMPWCVLVTHRMNIRKMQSVVAPYPTMGDLAVRVSFEFSRHLAQSSRVRKAVGLLKRISF